MSEAITSDRLLTRAELAQTLNAHGFPVTRATLATKAVRGGGPPYRMFGKYAVYRLDDALEWAKAKLVEPAHIGGPCST